MASKFRYKNSKVWWLKWYRNGKAYYESTHTRDRATADYLLAKKQQELSEGTLPAALKKISFDQAYNEYLEYSRAYKGRMTVKNDKNFIDAYLRDYGKPEILKNFDGQAFTRNIQKRVTGEEIKPITANGIIKSFKAFFNWCIHQNYLVMNPVKMRKFSFPDNPPKYLPIEDFKKLLEAAKKDPERLFYPFILTTSFLGLRPAEALHLEWLDFDFERDCVIIRNREDWTTKNKKYKILPIHSYLKKILLEYRQPTGKCFPIVNFVKRFRAFKRKAKIDMTMYSLRHSFGAYCALSGIPEEAIKDMMDHADIKTTHNYTKLRMDSFKHLIENLKFGFENTVAEEKSAEKSSKGKPHLISKNKINR